MSAGHPAGAWAPAPVLAPDPFHIGHRQIIQTDRQAQFTIAGHWQKDVHACSTGSCRARPVAMQNARKLLCSARLKKWNQATGRGAPACNTQWRAYGQVGVIVMSFIPNAYRLLLQSCQLCPCVRMQGRQHGRESYAHHKLPDVMAVPHTCLITQVTPAPEGHALLRCWPLRLSTAQHCKGDAALPG